MNIYLDIETIPRQPEDEHKALIAETIKHPSNMSKQETIDDWHAGKGKYEGVKDAIIDEAYRKTALDGTYGEVISIAFASGDNDVITLSRELGASEHNLLDEFFLLIADECKGRRPYFIGHNITFDLKFLFRRTAIKQVRNLSCPLPFDGRHGKDFFCTMKAWCGYGEYISQSKLCDAFGIEGKPEGIDGSKVWDYVKAGKIDDVVAYNRDDVEKVRLIHKRIAGASL